MKHILYISLSFIFIFLSCKSEEDKLIELIEVEVKALTTIEKKKDYLQKIFHTYINLRKQETEYWNTYGRNSDEYDNLIAANRNQDLSDMLRIEKYLDNYGYPSIMKFGYQPSIIPIVQSIQVDDLGVYLENYKYFYDAYKFNDISGELFLKYLRKLQFKTSDNQYSHVEYPESDNQMEENIETIIKELRLNK